LIGADKVAQVNIPFFVDVVFRMSIQFSPTADFFGDILTEVYGYDYVGSPAGS
jgi:queuosine precursor transporter